MDVTVGLPYELYYNLMRFIMRWVLHRVGSFNMGEVWFGTLLLLSTHSLDPCLWGESNHPAFGPPARLSLYLASISITPAGSVPKYRGDSVVCMWVQLKR